mmetsp:Transcript_13405/g.14837  ORF Transcript_13405/g.14837 Transcript_13405/m.14837 type:complete len:87 (+) Transcript_13405:64-324(+)
MFAGVALFRALAHKDTVFTVDVSGSTGDGLKRLYTQGLQKISYLPLYLVGKWMFIMSGADIPENGKKVIRSAVDHLMTQASSYTSN